MFLKANKDPLLTFLKRNTLNSGVHAPAEALKETFGMERSDVDTFEKLAGQFLSTYDEIALLSKRSPNDAVNKFKLKFINTLLAQGNKFMEKGYKPFDDFTQFDVDEVPHNSDVVFILSQYIQCFEKWKADNVVLRRG